MTAAEQAFNLGLEARMSGIPGYKNPFTHWANPDEACAWDDGWLNDGKRTSEELIQRLKSRK